MADSTGGGLLGLIYPQCNVPVHEITSEEVAAECGKYSGYLWVGGIALLCVIGLGLYVYHINTQPAGYVPAMSIITATLIAVGIVAVSWFAVPALTSYINVQSWKGYQARIQSLVAQGYSQQAALQQIETNDNVAQQVSATNNIAGAIMGGGIASSVQPPAPRAATA